MQMSINRALAEIKLLDKKIEKAINEGLFTSVAVGKKPVKGFKTNEEFEKTATSQFQSVEALIKRRKAIKSAIVKSNALTSVEVAGKEMTVAEAIEEKSFVVFKQKLLQKISYDFTTSVNAAEHENVRVKQRLDQLLEVNFGKDAKAKETDMDAISKPYLANNEAKVIDPLGSRNVIQELTNEIEEFLTEVDIVLTEINTITKIEIPE